MKYGQQIKIMSLLIAFLAVEQCFALSGNMTRDMVSGQDTIQWNLYNKVVRTVNNTDTSSMQFEYDAAGNRIAKHVIKTSATATTSKDEYYVRDAQGNILATYTGLVKKDLTGLPLYSSLGLAEHDIYGSSRLGMKQYYGLEIGASIDYTTSTIDTARLYDRMPWYSLEYQDVIKTDSVNLYGNKFTNMDFARNVTGQRQYELTDHLGDVLATVSDKRTGSTFAPLTGGGGSPLPGAVARINSWKPIVISAHDYYPFGSYMPGRYATDTSTGCVLTTISELLPDVYYQTIPIDTLSSAITTHGVTTINYTGGGTVLHMVTALTGSGLRVDLPASASGTHIDVDATVTIGAHVFRVKDASGTVIGSYSVSPGTSTGFVSIPITAPHTTTVSLIINCTAATGKMKMTAIHIPRDTVTAHNIVTTVCNNDFYRFGYNGKMKDNEWAGLGNSYDYGARNYQPRIARFIGVDPLAKKFPMLTPYQFASNTPIQAKDLDGKEAWFHPSNGDIINGPFSTEYIQHEGMMAVPEIHGGVTKMPAAEVNADLRVRLGYTNDAIEPGTYESQYTVNSPKTMVRLICQLPEGGTNKLEGEFLVDPNDIVGMGDENLQQDLALPGKVIGYRTVNVEGATIGVSKAAKNGLGKGGFKQIRLINPPSGKVAGDLYSKETLPFEKDGTFPNLNGQGEVAPESTMPAKEGMDMDVPIGEGEAPMEPIELPPL